MATSNLMISPRVQHDCAKHHLPIDPKAHKPYQIRSHDADDIMDAITHVYEQEHDDAAINGFLETYHSRNTDRMNLEDMGHYLGFLANRIDKYFFYGCLTEKNKYIKLRLFDHGKYGRLTIFYGVCYTPYLSTTMFNIHLFLYDRITGRRLPKIAILATLIHEMVHAFVCFFNYCPLKDNGALIGDGHGPLWHYVHLVIINHMKCWDVSLSKIEDKVTHRYSTEFYDYYFLLAHRFPLFRRHWFSPLKPQQPKNIFRHWPWDPDRKEMFKFALLQLRYGGYSGYVESIVPAPDVFVSRCIWFSILTVVSLIIYFFYYDEVVGGAAILAARILQAYRDGVFHDALDDALFKYFPNFHAYLRRWF